MMQNCNVRDLNARKDHNYVAFVLGGTELCFTVLYFKMSYIYALYVPSLNNMFKIVTMSFFFLLLLLLLLDT